MNIWYKSSALAFIATGVSYLVAVLAGWVNIVDPLEVVTVFFSYMSVIQAVDERRANYVTGIIGTLLYSLLFYKWEMYAVAAFNLYLVGSQAYGWWRWGSDDQTRPISTVKGVRGWSAYAVLGAVVWLLLSGVNSYFDYSPSGLEIFIVVASSVAQFLLDNKKKETWVAWGLVNIVSIAFYFHGGLYLVAIQYVFFLINVFYGWFVWTIKFAWDDRI